MSGVCQFCNTWHTGFCCNPGHLNHAIIEAETVRLRAQCDLYDATLADLHKMCGREGEPTTHGLDYTTILGHKLTRLESENAKLREILRPFGMAQVEHLHSYPDSELIRTSIGSFSLGDFRRAVKVQKGE